MKSNSKPSLVIITNLYPLPWEPNRATFNLQQFAQLHDDYDVSMLIPVAFPEWLKHRREIRQTKAIRFAPYFYLPKIGRRFYSVFMFLSLLIHSGVWLARRNPSVMLASWAFPEAVATSWLSKLYGARFFFKVHGSDINLHSKVPARAKQILSASKRALGILSVSKALSNEMQSLGVDSDKVEVIYNGVNHEKFGIEYPAPIESKYILYVGNLKRDKGVIELLEGFAGIASRYPDLKLVYAGSGAMKSILDNMAKEIGLSERVTMLGTVSHSVLPAWISNATILSLPSYNEGVPNVVLEAMASGTPVLATQVGGIPEVMAKDVTGQLIPARDSQAVTDGLDDMLKKTWDSNDIKQHSQQFSWQRNKSQLLSLLARQ